MLYTPFIPVKVLCGGKHPALVALAAAGVVKDKSSSCSFVTTGGAPVEVTEAPAVGKGVDVKDASDVDVVVCKGVGDGVGNGVGGDGVCAGLPP